MPLVIGVHYLNPIPLLRWLSRALPLSVIITVADKGSSCKQALSKSGKVLGTRLTFTKIKKNPDQLTNPSRKLRVGWRQTNNFLSPALLGFFCFKLFICAPVKRPNFFKVFSPSTPTGLWHERSQHLETPSAF